MASYESPLSEAEARRVFEAIVQGTLPTDELRTFLVTLARRGETAEEIAVGVAVLRAHAVRLPLTRAEELGDTCGTGGDGQDTINVSTLAGLVAAAAGARIAKHGNRAASSRCGSADVLEALGVNLAATPAQVARCIEEAGFGFCFAPACHPAMKAVAPLRKALAIRTIFNLIGPLANPAPLAFQLVGASHARLLRPMAEALVRLGLRHGLVVHGADGLDEITTTGPTTALEVRAGRITESRLEPETLGVPRGTLADLRGGAIEDNARIARELLAGRPLPARAIILANAGAALYVCDRARTIVEGVAQAREALDAGRAQALLEQVARLSHAG